MDTLTGLISCLQSINLDTETTLDNQIQLASTLLGQVEQFNKSNESKSSFTSGQKENSVQLGEQLARVLKRVIGYLDRCERNETSREQFKLTDVYYELSCHCLNTIRVLSRDTNVIGVFHVEELLEILQQAADLKKLALVSQIPTNQKEECSEPNFNQKESLSLSEAEIVIKSRERHALSLSALKAMSNLIFNSKYVQEFYERSELAQSISIYLRNLLVLANKDSKQGVHVNAAEAEILQFKLKLLFLMTVFVKSLRSVVCDQFMLLVTFRQLMARLDLQEPADCDLVIDLLKISYNLTMDIEGVRAQAHQALSSIKTAEFLNTPTSAAVGAKDEVIFKELTECLRGLMCPKSASVEEHGINATKQLDLTCNTINLLTNLPSFCYESLIPPVASVESDVTPFTYEGKSMTSIQAMLEFLTENLNLYVDRKQSADILYPGLMLFSVICKSNRTIRRYLRSQILPPLTKADLVSLPQHGKSVRNLLVKVMTDPNMQLKRLCAQFLFILCKESVGRLIKYTGYGNAAGLLAEAGLMLSSHGDKGAYSSDSDNSDSEEYSRLERDINPITGQAEVDDVEEALKKKKRDIFEGMTEEQKEYEAVQLANAIDKLSRMGHGIKPATIGPDGRPVEMEHILQLQDKKD